ncbi:hypothetical protein Syun_025564 [Stephania yunnanensis]|uniref:Uncharacterized protein n=1 Tax=Stephania yunnanensis TaxID=152371 RepID=A0AAP0HV79_9MAGN
MKKITSQEEIQNRNKTEMDRSFIKDKSSNHPHKTKTKSKSSEKNKATSQEEI